MKNSFVVFKYSCAACLPHQPQSQQPKSLRSSTQQAPALEQTRSLRSPTQQPQSQQPKSIRSSTQQAPATEQQRSLRSSTQQPPVTQQQRSLRSSTQQPTVLPNVVQDLNIHITTTTSKQHGAIRPTEL